MEKDDASVVFLSIYLDITRAQLGWSLCVCGGWYGVSVSVSERPL